MSALRQILAGCALLSAFAAARLDARDVNLDSIYLAPGAPYALRLMKAKREAYDAAGAVLVDRGVIFADWASRDEIAYIREFEGSDVNAVCVYDVARRRSREVKRIRGTVSAARMSAGGVYYVLKRIMLTGRGMLAGQEIVVVTLPTGTSRSLPSPSVSVDFSLPSEGGSILFEDAGGIQEHFLFSGAGRTLMPKGLYAGAAPGAAQCVPFLSPDRNAILIVNGGGGSYRASLFRAGGKTAIRGITSSSELYWVDNSMLSFRKGGPGSFSVALYNVVSGEEHALPGKSLDTNLCFSGAPGVLAYSVDQMIRLSFAPFREAAVTGLEGGEVYFDRAGGKFSALLCKDLYLVNYSQLQNRKVEMKRVWSAMLDMYREARADRKCHANDFSAEYLSRKVAQYSELVNR